MCFEFLPARSHPVHCSASLLRDSSKKIPVLPERMFSSFLDFRNPLHCMECGLHKIAVIANRNIPALLEINSRILRSIQVSSIRNNQRELDTYDNHLLPCSLSESFSPPYFARVSLHPNARAKKRDPVEGNDNCLT